MENSNAFVSLLISEPVYIIEKTQSEIPVEKTQTTPSGSKETPIVTAKPQDLKKVIIHCQDKNTGDLAFLSKILLAVHITDKEAYITTTLDTEEQISSNKHIYFGLNSGISQGANYELVKSGENMILHADSLAEIQQDVNKKKLLWGALQKMFL